MTHPSTAQQAKEFTAPGALSGFNAAGGHLTPPSSEKDGQAQQVSRNGTNGSSQGGNAAQQQPQQAGNGVTPATPAATPGAGQGVSGIVPTLQ